MEKINEKAHFVQFLCFHTCIKFLNMKAQTYMFQGKFPS